MCSMINMFDIDNENEANEASMVITRKDMTDRKEEKETKAKNMKVYGNMELRAINMEKWLI